MGQVPIYDQLRGERINADVPASETDLQRVERPGKHRLLADAPSAAAVFGPPGPGADIAANQRHHVWTYPVDQPVGDGQQGPAVREPLAAPFPEAHARRAPTHAKSSPAPAAGHSPVPQGAAADDRGAHRKEAMGPRQGERTDPRAASPAGAEFSWFGVGPRCV